MSAKNFPAIVRGVLTSSPVLALSLPHSGYGKHNPPPESEDQGRDDGLQDQDDGHRRDPGERALRGKAFERDRRCPPVGSSSGIARGDFNGDGFSDLAVGIPFADPFGILSAGRVAVVYGNANRLLFSPTVPSSRFFTSESTGVDREQGAFFGAALAAGNFNGDRNAQTGPLSMIWPSAPPSPLPAFASLTPAYTTEKGGDLCVLTAKRAYAF
jgi:hypothetical protein